METTTLLADPEHAFGRLKQGSDAAVSGQAILFIIDAGDNLVIYQLAGLPFKAIMLDDGNVSIPLGTATGTTAFSGFTTAGPVSATTTFMVGDGQFHATTPVIFTGSLGTLSLLGLFAANNGPLWDTDTFNVSSVVGAGSSSDSATIRVSSDCLLWSAQAFSVTTAPVTPIPVTATAAVVKTSATGDTVVNGRGLIPIDQPTLQDRIEMIVLNRVMPTFLLCSLCFLREKSGRGWLRIGQ